MKHPLTKLLNTNSSPLGSLIFLGAIFYLSFKNPQTLKNPLKINDVMKSWVKENAHALISLSPRDFLLLTTSNEDDYNNILENARSLDFYNTPEINEDMDVHPFLWIDEHGVIIAHEGRHRAMATMNNNEKTYEVAIMLEKPEKGIPNRLIAQSSKREYFVAIPKPKWIKKVLL